MAARPIMYVVAGPPGSGKSFAFDVTRLGVDGFNVDDRCAARHGSYRDIPPHIRSAVQGECEHFVRDHIAARRSFATETTLRATVAVDQARIAAARGFFTQMLFVCTDDVAINIKRVAIRGRNGGHSAPASTIRDIYLSSLKNLVVASNVFDHIELFDSTLDVSTGSGPRFVMSIDGGKVAERVARLPRWVPFSE